MKNHRKALMLLLVGLFILALFAVSVYAAETWWDADKKPWDNLKTNVFPKIAGVLNNISTEILDTGTPSDTSVVVLRSLIFIIVFAVLWLGSKAMPNASEQRNIRRVIVLILSIMVALTLPMSFIANLVRAYGAIFVVVLGGAPAIAATIWAVAIEGDSRPKYLFKTLVASFASVLLIIASNGLEPFTSVSNIVNLLSYALFWAGWLFFLFYAVGYCFFVGTIAGHEKAEKVAEGADKLDWKKVLGIKKKEEELESAEKKLETAGINQYVRDQEESVVIGEAAQKFDELMVAYKDLTRLTNVDVSRFNNVMALFGETKSKIDDAYNWLRRLSRRQTYRAQRQIEDFLKMLKDEKIDTKNIEQVHVANILDKHLKASNALYSANTALTKVETEFNKLHGRLRPGVLMTIPLVPGQANTVARRWLVGIWNMGMKVTYKKLKEAETFQREAVESLTAATQEARTLLDVAVKKKREEAAAAREEH